MVIVAPLKGTHLPVGEVTDKEDGPLWEWSLESNIASKSTDGVVCCVGLPQALVKGRGAGASSGATCSFWFGEEGTGC